MGPAYQRSLIFSSRSSCLLVQSSSISPGSAVDWLAKHVGRVLKQRAFPLGLARRARLGCVGTQLCNGYLFPQRPTSTTTLSLKLGPPSPTFECHHRVNPSSHHALRSNRQTSSCSDTSPETLCFFSVCFTYQPPQSA